jgi:hypothetical protein
MSKLPADFGDSEKKFDPAEMQRRVDQMKAEGKMPSMEEFAQMMGMVREEWHRGTFDQPEETRPAGSPQKKRHSAARRPN